MCLTFMCQNLKVSWIYLKGSLGMCFLARNKGKMEQALTKIQAF